MYWQQISTAKTYTLWRAIKGAGRIKTILYQVTEDGKRPKNSAGYGSIEYLEQMKRVHFAGVNSYRTTDARINQTSEAK